MNQFNFPALVGSMFYQGDDHIIDVTSGEIDEPKVAKRINSCQKLSEEFGVSFVLDLEIPSVEAAKNIIDFVGTHTNIPLWISSFDAKMRIEACKIAIDKGLKDRIFYSTLNYMSDDDEFQAVADMGINPVIQVFNPENPLTDGYLAKAEELLNLAKKAGIAVENAVLLPTVLDFGSISLSLLTIPLLKEKYMLPICVPSIGPVNNWAKQYPQDTRRLLLASTLTYTLGANADLVHIGSIKRAFMTFPVISLINQFEKRKESLAQL
jgi:tetrahydromethanopterin S-methyltransferase subunit H